MSDRDPLDSMDVDLLCRDLLTDIDTRTQARGADQAIRTAGRRRRAAGGALLSVVVLAGLVIGILGLPVNRPVTPAGPPSPTSSLPAPRVLDAAALNAATEGWLSGWQRESLPTLADLRCLPKDRAYPESVSQWGSEFVIGKTIRATQTAERFASAEQAEEAYEALNHMTADCFNGGLSYYSQAGSWDGSMSFVYTYEDKGSMGHAFVVRYEDKVTLLTVTGPIDRPSYAVEDRVIDALVADLRT